MKNLQSDLIDMPAKVIVLQLNERDFKHYYLISLSSFNKVLGIL